MTNRACVSLAAVVLLSSVEFLFSQTAENFILDTALNEQSKTFLYSPEVRIHINAPEHLDLQKPTTLTFYALPNGNTIEQTIGKQAGDGVDWHFNIQHIGAQTRRLRQVLMDANFIIVYLETEGKSWPQWRRKHANSNELISHIVDSVRNIFKSLNPMITLSGHSGGGSFIFGFLISQNRIPPEVERISFLDSNYGYDENEKHGDKLVEWLRASNRHFLNVIAYDDRYITLNGKRVVSDSGGIYRATHRMLVRLQKDFALTEDRESVIERYRGLNGQIDIRIHTNPDTLILHTVLVEKNGFIHAMTSGTQYENIAGVFWGEAAYAKWIAK